MEKLKIVHTNDLHSHFEHFPKIERFISQKREETQKDNFLLFDIGDFMDRFHAYTEATNGIGNVKWLNKNGYDAVTIGNNEGLGNSHEELSNLFKDAKFPVVLSNMYDLKTEKKPDFVVDDQIFETKEGTKIGIFGLTAPYHLTYPLLGWDFYDLEQTIQRKIDDLTKKTDMIILLSHLGISTDTKIAENHPEISVIIGAHTHHLLRNGRKVNQSYLAAAGKYGEFVGEIDVEIDNHKLSGIKLVAHDVEELPEEEQDKSQIHNYTRTGHQLLSQNKVAVIDQDIGNDFTQENSNIRYALKAIEEVTDTDIAILNNGLFLTDLKKGKVTDDDFHTMLPHSIHPMTTTLPGNEVWRLMMEMEANRNFLRLHQQKGMGFRGKVFGELVYDGIETDFEKREVKIHGQDIDFNKEYTIGMIDHYLFVAHFPTIKIMGKNKLYYPDFIRTVYKNYIRKQFN